MDLSVTFLGTGGAVPSARRSTASVLVSRGGERLLFDCGEGTQRQMQKSVGLVQVDEIYLTHFHSDHFLGLPGLLKTYDLTDRETPLTIYGPVGLSDLFNVLGRLIGRIGFDLNLVELEPGDVIDVEAGVVRPFAVEHRFGPSATRWSRTSDRAASTSMRQRASASLKARPSRPCSAASPSTALPARSPPTRWWARPVPAAAIAITGDTGPCDGDDRRGARGRAASSTTPASPRRRRSGPAIPATRPSVRRRRSPATPRWRCSPCVHISSRYHVGVVLEEAREVFRGRSRRATSI